MSDVKRGRGRPVEATEPLKKKTFSLPESVRDIIEAQPNQTEFIVTLVQAYGKHVSR